MTTRKPPDAFGRRLKALREAAGLSAERLAAAVGTSRSYVFDLEAGRREPSLDLARRLARALGHGLAAFD